MSSESLYVLLIGCCEIGAGFVVGLAPRSLDGVILCKKETHSGGGISLGLRHLPSIAAAVFEAKDLPHKYY
jgi:hypothetical protein